MGSVHPIFVFNEMICMSVSVSSKVDDRVILKLCHSSLLTHLLLVPQCLCVSFAQFYILSVKGDLYFIVYFPGFQYPRLLPSRICWHLSTWLCDNSIRATVL